MTKSDILVDVYLVIDCFSGVYMLLTGHPAKYDCWNVSLCICYFQRTNSIKFMIPTHYQCLVLYCIFIIRPRQCVAGLASAITQGSYAVWTFLWVRGFFLFCFCCVHVSESPQMMYFCTSHD